MKQTEYPVTALRVCINSIGEDNDHISGSICGVALADAYPFDGSPDFLLLIDHLLDKIGKPQASRLTRSFSGTLEEQASERGGQATYCGSPVRYRSSAEIAAQHGAMYTFDIFFTSRLKSSWQGFVKNEDGETLGSFKSDVDFIRLMRKQK